jgi:hypothetical protein
MSKVIQRIVLASVAAGVLAALGACSGKYGGGDSPKDPPPPPPKSGK